MPSKDATAEERRRELWQAGGTGQSDHEKWEINMET